MRRTFPGDSGHRRRARAFPEPNGNSRSPVDILCEGEIAVRVILVRSPDSAAVGIAEAVAHEVLRIVGLEAAVEFGEEQVQFFGNPANF